MTFHLPEPAAGASRLSVDDTKPESVVLRRGAVGVVYQNQRFLVIRRSALVAAPLKYCFPGGAIEPGESEEQALIRELDEELGVRATPLGRLWESVTPWKVELNWWQALLHPHDQLMPNPAEVEAIHWYTAAEMLALPDLLESNRAFLAAIARREVQLIETA
jgi:8-oxo-dGTP diphosphatase